MEYIRSITKGPRESNFELLRIVAMFLVLVVHADFFSIGAPTPQELRINPLNVFWRTFFESLSIICVNIFILISGWFRIKPSIKGISNFIFQCIFFYLGIYFVFCFFSLDKLTFTSLLHNIYSLCNNWFINSYIALYILAPVLNNFIENTDKNKLKFLIINFYLFQTIFGMMKVTNYIAGGFSVFSFIGLYVLAGYFRKYVEHKTYILYLVLFCCSTFLICGIYILGLYMELNIGNVFSYINPLVVLSALSSVMIFSKISLKKNIFINWLSISTFAVFLFHCHPNISNSLFKESINYIYYHYSGLICIICLFIILLIFYIVAILFDQLRKLCWKNIVLPIIRKLSI